MSHTLHHESINNIIIQEGEYGVIYNNVTKIHDEIMQGYVNVITRNHLFVADTEADVLEFIEQEGLTLEEIDHENEWTTGIIYTD